VIRVPGAEGVRGFLNNQEVGRTNGSGNLVVPNLLPYYGNRISIADSDVALSRGVSAVERTIAPPLRGGALVLFESRAARFFRGRVTVLRAGKPETPSYGELSVHKPAGGDTVSPLGQHGEFEVPDLEPGLYGAQIVYAGGTCAFTLPIPATALAVTNLGERRCVALP